MNGRDEIRSTVRRVFDGHSTPACVAKRREVRDLPAGCVVIRGRRMAGMRVRLE